MNYSIRDMDAQSEQPLGKFSLPIGSSSNVRVYYNMPKDRKP